MLGSWAEQLSGHASERARGVLRFAFYGRVSTGDWQDPVTSRSRQLQQAVMLAGGVGVIMAEFFDAGESRELPVGGGPGTEPAPGRCRVDAADGGGDPG